MALLNTKFDEDTMYGQLKGALLPNENIKAAVYATFQDMSFFGSRASQVQTKQPHQQGIMIAD